MRIQEDFEMTAHDGTPLRKAAYKGAAVAIRYQYPDQPSSVKTPPFLSLASPDDIGLVNRRVNVASKSPSRMKSQPTLS